MSNGSLQHCHQGFAKALLALMKPDVVVITKKQSRPPVLNKFV